MIGDDVKVAVTEVGDVRVLLTVSHRAGVNGGIDRTMKYWMKSDEATEIADGIVCSVMMISHGKVRLGFRCPDTVRIDRAEIYEINRRERERQKNAPGSDNHAGPI
jgi:carbon storage regulator CsrA